MNILNLGCVLQEETIYSMLASGNDDYNNYV